MANPILAPNSTWFTQGGTTVSKNSITIIELKDSYTPTGTVTSSWDASAAKDGSVMAYVEGTTLTISGNGSGRIFANVDSSNIFNGFNKLVVVSDKDHVLSTTKSTTFERMFQACFALESVDSGHWTTNNVTTFCCMFQGATSIRDLDVSHWSTSNVESMRGMFNMPGNYINTNLTTLDVSNWDTGKVTDLWAMFNDCRGLARLDVSNWDVSNVIDMSCTFQGCEELVELNVSSWDTSSCVNMSSMFRNCHSLKTLDVSSWDTSSCVNMSSMFHFCTSLEELDVSNWDVSKVESFSSMFSSGNLGETPMIIKKLDVSKWDTSSCTSMVCMFYGCKGPKAIDVSNWDVSKVTTFDHMTAHSHLTLVNGVGNWKTPAAVNMNAMFYSVSNVGEFDVSNLITDNVISFAQMFEGCSKVTRFIGLENFDTSSGLDFGEMFRRCFQLKELDLSSFDTRNATVGASSSANGSKTICMRDMFFDTPRLEKVTLGSNFSFIGDGTASKDYCCTLLAPSSEYLNGADGSWYTYEGDSYLPEDIPNMTSCVYYAINPVMDRDYIVKGRSFVYVADTIRAKSGLSGKLQFPEGYSEAIRSFSDSGVLDRFLSGTLEGVTIPEGVSTVRPYLFFQEKNLQYVVLPDTVTEIGTNAFAQCSRLNLETLPPNIVSLGNSCFASCQSITLSDLPSGLTEIPYNGFSKCSKLRLTSLPAGITKIGDWGFEYCSELKLTSLPDGITVIGKSSMRSCSGCSFSELPSSLVEVGSNAMSQIGEGLTFKKIPSSVTKIGDSAFANGYGLTEITFEGTPDLISSTAFSGCVNITVINVPWAEGEVASAPWGAVNATINYNYVA